jgi:predicted dehydrogenase
LLLHGPSWANASAGNALAAGRFRESACGDYYHTGGSVGTGAGPAVVAAGLLDSRPVTEKTGDDRPVRWGLIGCGDIAARRVAAALRDSPHSAFVAVARRRAVLSESFAREHGARRAHADWLDLVRDDEVDAVYVATPVHLHAEQAIAAADAGKHVLCEKPMALTVEECQRMIAAAERNRVRLGVAYYRHHYPVVARLRELLASAEIGRPVLCRVDVFEPFNPAAGGERSWLLDRAQAGGGPMMDFGCHRIEVLLDLFGPLQEASGFLANVRYRDRDVEDTCVAHLGFRGGAQAILAVTHAAGERRDTFDVYGSAGSVQVPALNDGILRIVGGPSTREERHPPHPNLHQPLVEDFVAAVREGRRPAVDGGVGLEVSRVLAAIYARRPDA